jgi:hypothetical protein
MAEAIEYSSPCWWPGKGEAWRRTLVGGDPVQLESSAELFGMARASEKLSISTRKIVGPYLPDSRLYGAVNQRSRRDIRSFRSLVALALSCITRGRHTSDDIVIGASLSNLEVRRFDNTSHAVGRKGSQKKVLQ